MLFGLVFGLIDFLKLLLPLTILFFVLFKMFFVLKTRIEERFGLSWIKTCLLLNFVTIGLLLFFVYFYFMMIGSVLAPPTEIELTYNFAETSVMVFLAGVRIIISSIILSIALLFFEFFASFVISLQEEKNYSITIKEFVGVLSTTALFLFLLLFFFNWVPLGLFVYIFFGSIGETPLLITMIYSNFGLVKNSLSLQNLLGLLIS